MSNNDDQFDVNSSIVRKTIEIARLLKKQTGSSRKSNFQLKTRVYKEQEVLGNKITETLRLLKKSASDQK